MNSPDIDMHSAGSLSYKFLAGTYNPDEDTSGLTLMVEASGFMQVENFNHEGIQYCGALVWETPLEGLRLGASGWSIKDGGADVTLPHGAGPLVPPGTAATLNAERWASVFSIEYTWNNLRIAGEYRFQHTEGEWGDGLKLPKTDTDAEGYYIGAAYRFTDWFELGSYYSEFFPDKDNKDGEGYADDFRAWQKDFALTARFDINEYWLVKLEGHCMDGAAEWMFPDDNPDGYEQNDFLFAAKVTFNF